MNSESDRLGTGMQQFEAFEQKMDELRDGLLEAYEAGYKKAIDDQMTLSRAGAGELPKKEDVEGSDYLAESHYYYWDGRTLPLEFWLREQFGLDGDSDD